MISKAGFATTALAILWFGQLFLFSFSELKIYFFGSDGYLAAKQWVAFYCPLRSQIRSQIHKDHSCSIDRPTRAFSS